MSIHSRLIDVVYACVVIIRTATLVKCNINKDLSRSYQTPKRIHDSIHLTIIGDLIIASLRWRLVLQLSNNYTLHLQKVKVSFGRNRRTANVGRCHESSAQTT